MRSCTIEMDEVRLQMLLVPSHGVRTKSLYLGGSFLVDGSFPKSAAPDQPDVKGVQDKVNQCHKFHNTPKKGQAILSCIQEDSPANIR